MPVAKKSLRLIVNLVPVNGDHKAEPSDIFAALKVLEPMITNGATSGNTPVKVKASLQAKTYTTDQEPPADERAFLANWSIS